MSKALTIPIIILNWNGIEDTIKSVDSVLSQTYQSNHLFLADNASDNREGEQLRERYKEVENLTFIQFDDNLGFTGAHIYVYENYIKDKGFIWMALLNNDAFAENEWLSALLKAGNTFNAGMVSCKMIQFYEQDKIDNVGHFVLNTAETIPAGHGESIQLYNKVEENFGACGGACLYNLEMLENIGFFDPHFSTGYEDAELGIRAIVSGYTSIYTPEAVVYHKGGQSIDKIRSQDYLIGIQRHIFYAFFKLMPISVLLFNLPFMLFKYGMVILIDIVFLRLTFLKMMLKAIQRTVQLDGKKIRNSRQQFYSRNKSISFFKIQQRLTFFLWFDIKRFFKYVVFNKATFFEKGKDR